MPTKQQEAEAEAVEVEVEEAEQVDPEQAIAQFEEEARKKTAESVEVLLAERAIFREAGLVVYDPKGEWVATGTIRERIWKITSEEIVVSDDDYANLPVQRKRLASEVLDVHPAHKTDEWFARDSIWRQGWEKAESTIWKQIDHRYGAALQRWTRERLGKGHFFLKDSDSVFITTQPKYVEREIFLPVEDKIEGWAAYLGKTHALCEQQMPALKGFGKTPKLLGSRVQTKQRGAYDATASNGADGGDEQE
jgi:hypothetical protein